jgi:hypothetical protein
MKDLPKGIDQEWRMKAKGYAKWLRPKVLYEEKFLMELLTRLEDIAADEEFSGWETEKKLVL